MEQESGALRFNSVNRRVAALLDSNQTKQINYRLDQQISYLLLDEFQDTSLDQWKVLSPFATEAMRDNEPGSLFCVGDTKQAIYGWRGGVAEIFDLVQESLDSDDVSELTQSRRSSPEVIEAVNRVFLNAHTARGLGRMKSAVEQWQQRFSRHSAFHAEMPGHVTLQRVLKDEDRNVREFAAEQIAELVARHPDRSIGVLVRTNKIVNEMIFNLSAVGVKASEEGGNPLMDSAAVGLIASLLHSLLRRLHSD